jgi:hypothetical protein
VNKVPARFHGGTVAPHCRRTAAFPDHLHDRLFMARDPARAIRRFKNFHAEPRGAMRVK